MAVTSKRDKTASNFRGYTVSIWAIAQNDSNEIFSSSVILYITK